MIEYVVAAGGNVAGLFGGLTTNPYLLVGGAVLLLIIYLFTTRG